MKNLVTMGTFDGVHTGHRHLIKTLVREADRAGRASLVIYFPVPPRHVLKSDPNPPRITLPREREKLLYDLGVKKVAPLEFTPSLAGMGARIFFEKIFLGRFKAGGFVVGKDFAFGKNREGGIGFLRAECRRRGLFLKVVPFIKAGGHKLSSSVIRCCLFNGDVGKASALLGRHYEVSGTVVRGAGLGRKLGFPTANILVEKSKILPPGVFTVKVRLGKEIFLGVANVGFRPTIFAHSPDRPLLEIHILDFDRNIYGETLSAEFVRKIRGEHRYKNQAELIKHIKLDIITARKHARSMSQEL